MSGIVGVRRTKTAWIAHGSPRPGERKMKNFSKNEYGEEGAKERAVALRKQWEEEMVLYEKRIIVI